MDIALGTFPHHHTSTEPSGTMTTVCTIAHMHSIAPPGKMRVLRSRTSIASHRRHRLVTTASASSSRPANPAAANLRELLKGETILRAPCAHDALTAALIERAGFKMGFMSGFCVSAARLAMPDAGLISYGEMGDVGRHITQATADPAFPFIGDADDGYGNAMNAKRTVRGYARAGFAGILMEDQAAPKACGHTKPKVLPRDEAVARVRAACDERDEGVGGDIVVFARSDSRSAMDSLDEALWRVATMLYCGTPTQPHLKLWKVSFDKQSKPLMIHDWSARVTSSRSRHYTKLPATFHALQMPWPIR